MVIGPSMRNLIDFKHIRRVLCLGAHSDDIEIGCGGTLSRLMRENEHIKCSWFVACGVGVRGDEARASAEAFNTLERHQLHLTVGEFRDAHLPAVWAETKRAVSALRDFDPDLIFTHRLDDRHQDHRVIAELTAQTFRDHPVLGYEIPKYDGDLGQPNVFVPLSPEDFDAKRHALRPFVSQQDKQWFDDDTFAGLARLRGLECNAPSRLAEGFYARKLVA